MGFFDKLKGGMGIENSQPAKTKNKDKIKVAAPKKKTKSEPKPELKPEIKSEPKPELKPEPKIEAKPEIEPEPKPEPKKKIQFPKLEHKKTEPKKEEPQTEGELAIDVYETENDIVVQSTIGGIKPENLDISIENDMVTIRGNREHLVEKEGKNYIYQECYWGSFARKIILPEEVDETKIKATTKNGILTLVMPKLHKRKKKKVAIKLEE